MAGAGGNMPSLDPKELLMGIAGIATITCAESRAPRGLPPPSAAPELPSPNRRGLLLEAWTPR